MCLRGNLPGEYTLHDIIIDGIPTGATLEWEVQVTGLPAGSCRPNPAPSDPITVCWIADTMYPKSERVSANALLMAPDLLQFAERTHGWVELIVEEGSVFVSRINEDGETTDSFSFPTG